jgi:hypothetical protein
VYQLCTRKDKSWGLNGSSLNCMNRCYNVYTYQLCTRKDKSWGLNGSSLNYMNRCYSVPTVYQKGEMSVVDIFTSV